MNNFIKKILEKHDYQHIGESIELWNNNNEFFMIQDYDVEELQSSLDETNNFFTCKKTNQLISEFEKIQDNIIYEIDNLEELLDLDPSYQSILDEGEEI